MGIKIMNSLEEKEKKIPEEFKEIAKDFAKNGFVTTSTNNLINSTWPLPFEDRSIGMAPNHIIIFPITGSLHQESLMEKYILVSCKMAAPNA